MLAQAREQVLRTGHREALEWSQDETRPSSHRHVPNYSGKLVRDLLSPAGPSATVLKYGLQRFNVECVTEPQVQPLAQSVQTLSK